MITGYLADNIFEAPPAIARAMAQGSPRKVTTIDVTAIGGAESKMSNFTEATAQQATESGRDTGLDTQGKVRSVTLDPELA